MDDSEIKIEQTLKVKVLSYSTTEIAEAEAQMLYQPQHPKQSNKDANSKPPKEPAKNNGNGSSSSQSSKQPLLRQREADQAHEEDTAGCLCPILAHVPHFHWSKKKKKHALAGDQFAYDLWHNPREELDESPGHGKKGCADCRGNSGDSYTPTLRRVKSFYNPPKDFALVFAMSISSDEDSMVEVKIDTSNFVITVEIPLRMHSPCASVQMDKILEKEELECPECGREFVGEYGVEDLAWHFNNVHWKKRVERKRCLSMG
ncbi:hypothetical protein NHQ30_009483 [Ciborinia camelliae]|nr:hypothetical protein NHQ30_009483 [Ciborinia camelliae]